MDPIYISKTQDLEIHFVDSKGFSVLKSRWTLLVWVVSLAKSIKNVVKYFACGPNFYSIKLASKLFRKILPRVMRH